MATNKPTYPATLKIDYPGKLDRLSSFFRIFWAIPIIIISGLISASGSETYTNAAGEKVIEQGGGIMAGLSVALALMILFRQRYPKWWFNFILEYTRFTTRVGAYLFLLTDKYPSTEDQQSVHLDINYPDAKKLSRGLPLIKWLLALPHYLVLMFLVVMTVILSVVAWFSILFTGKYPRNIFDFVVGVNRWFLRVNAYAFLLTTDEYPPFSLN